MHNVSNLGDGGFRIITWTEEQATSDCPCFIYGALTLRRPYAYSNRLIACSAAPDRIAAVPVESRLPDCIDDLSSDRCDLVELEDGASMANALEIRKPAAR